MTYQDLLVSLPRDAKTLEKDGLRIEIRNCADRMSGHLDPRTEAPVRFTREEFVQNQEKFDTHLVSNIDHLYGPLHPEEYTPLEALRFTFGWNTDDLSHDVATEALTLHGSMGDVPVWKYTYTGVPQNNLPCMILYHGGGFFGGVIPTVENQCRRLAELMKGIVFAVDYPLCPESPYPIGFNASYEALEMIFNRAQELGIDAKRIGVFGDSAGGNFALAVCIRNREEKKGMVAYQALIYPTVIRYIDKQGPYWFWNREDYDIAQPDPWLEKQISPGFDGENLLNSWYVPDGVDKNDPYLNPITDSLVDLPKTLVMTAEYDYLRAECEGLCRKMLRAGNDVRYIRYGGIVHGTFDRIGYAPQVEDMLKEIAKDITTL